VRTLLFLISPILLFLAACERPEPLVKKPNVPEGTQTKVFGMGENYENQIWFEFSTQQVAINRHDNWDIAFSCDASHRILVNGGKNANFMVASFPDKDFNSFTKTSDLAGAVWEFDNPSGLGDSLVFRDWCLTGTAGQYIGRDILYVFDLGDDTLGLTRYIKFKITERNGGVYAFKWSYLEDTSARVEEYKGANETQNYIYYNFSTQSEVYNEPLDKNHWDIVFTTYKKWIPNPDNGNMPYPYVLRGVMSNPNKVKVAEVTGIIGYDAIDLNFAQGISFYPGFDEIGYDWKLWSMTANKYTVDQSKIYVIRDTKGDYYKLKFVDFYDDQGHKGYPKMAWEALQ
jgi:hypothetical protein